MDASAGGSGVQRLRYGDLKKKVADIAAAKIEPIQKRYREIVAEPGYVADVLRSGAERVSPLANATVEVVKQRMVCTPRADMEARPASPTAYFRLLARIVNFRLLWFAQIVSEIGDWFYAVAIYSLCLSTPGAGALSRWRS